MGQRERLFTLAVEIGAADTAEPDGAGHLAERCLAMTQELREHAEHEDHYIHPLLRERAPEAADALDAEHVRLDAALAALDDRARRLQTTPAESLPDAQHGLYLTVNELISAYLAHLHAEETVAMPALWDRCSDAELGEVFAAFKASRTPEENLTDLRGMLPSLPPAVPDGHRARHAGSRAGRRRGPHPGRRLHHPRPTPAQPALRRSGSAGGVGNYGGRARTGLLRPQSGTPSRRTPPPG